MTLLSISGMSVALGGKPVLSGISFNVASGEFVGLIGPNGAGKSTLLRAALRLVDCDGVVRLAGRAVETMPARRLAQEVAYLPQERDVAWPVTVETLVGLGRSPHRARFAAPSPEDDAIVEQAMRRMDVLAFAKRPATELSGGETARVLIARALAQNAPLLLADEPAAGLDPSHQIVLMRSFAELAAEGRAVVASMHDLGLAARWCSRLVLIEQGRLVADGPPRSVLTASLLRQVYGVEAYVGEAAGGLIVQPLDLTPSESLPGKEPA